MDWIDRINSPEDLKALAPTEVPAYCDALRNFLIRSVLNTGGHLGSNLGVVELTVALHRVFDLKKDRLVLDTSHQVYPHKVITGRRERFDTLRTTDGLSGFMHRGESPYDTFTAGHAGTAVSVAAGMALADKLRGIDDRRVIALVGDAAAASGATFEALNDAGNGDGPDGPSNLLVILNDNQWSIARTVGAMRKYLNRIRTLPAYREGKSELLDALNAVPFVGDKLSRLAGNMKDALANATSPGHLFRELGWTYFGPENGHDVMRMEQILLDLKRVSGPVLLHVVTEKGRGAPDKGNDAAHAVAPLKMNALKVPRPKTKTDVPAVPSIKYQDAFGRSMAQIMEHDPRVVAITAAMPGGTGLAKVLPQFPKRVIDVGICEQHGVAVAAGMADSGLKPVVAIYSTFLQRGYDQVWQEVVVQGLPVIFAMDRAGIVGGDGVTHQGLYDIAYLRTFPDVCLMAPADPIELDSMLRFALQRNEPVGIRYPRGGAPDSSLPGNESDIRYGKGEMLRRGDDVALVAYGTMVRHSLEAAEILATHGVDASVFNARFARPLDQVAIERMANRCPLLFTVEEHTVNGGFGSAVLECLHALPTPPTARVRILGVPDQLVWHGDAKDWMRRFELDAQGIAARVLRERTAMRVTQAPTVEGAADATSDGARARE